MAVLNCFATTRARAHPPKLQLHTKQHPGTRLIELTPALIDSSTPTHTKSPALQPSHHNNSSPHNAHNTTTNHTSQLLPISPTLHPHFTTSHRTTQPCNRQIIVHTNNSAFFLSCPKLQSVFHLTLYLPLVHTQTTSHPLLAVTHQLTWLPQALSTCLRLLQQSVVPARGSPARPRRVRASFPQLALTRLDTLAHTHATAKDPNAPKRGLSAYMFFANEQRENVREENPGIKFGKSITAMAHGVEVFLFLDACANSPFR